MSPLLRTRTLLGVAVAASLCYASIAGGQATVAKPVAVGTGTAGKKGKDGKDDRDWNEPITLPVERAAKDKIDAVNKYVQGKEPVTEKIWGDIISVVQTMLDDPADKFVEIDAKGNKVSIKLEVNRIIGSFNKDGLEFYQRNVGPTAEQRYKQAADENDMAMMGEVASRYLHTKAGAAAAIRVGNWHLDRGRYMQAEKSLRSLTLRDPKNELSPELLYKAALAMKRAGQTADAAGYWEKLEKVTNKGAVPIGTKQIDFDKLKAEYEKATPQVALFTSEHGLFRRDPTNNGVGSGTTPFLEPKFRYEFANPVDDIHYESKKGGFEALKDRIDKALKLLDTKGMAPIPGSFPLASNGKLIFRGYDGVYCIATREDKSVDPPIKPGELLWKSETDGGLLQMFKDIGPRTLADQWLGMYTGSGPHGILIENPLLGTLSHDGRVVYVVDDLALPPHPQQWSQAQFQGGYQPRFGVFDDAVNHSRLKAIDIETGKLLWKVGERVNQNPTTMNPGFGAPVAIDDTGRPIQPKKEAAPPPPNVKETTETLLADCFFLGPPLPLAGKLYCVIEKDGDLKLVCLDPSRLEKSTRADKRELMPTLVWSQALGQPNGKLPQDAFRRFQGVHLAYADGILVVPTNAGAVLGIDLFSHSLIWAASYKSNKTNKQPMVNEEMQFRGRGMPVQNQALAYETSRERWHASAPIIHNGKVIFTAFDSDTVECIDLQEGRSIWKSPITRQDGDQYVAGVFDDKVMVVGRGSVRFHNVATGAQMKDPLPTGVPTGVGVATAGTYFLPIKAAKDKSNEPGIVAIDTKAMAIKGTSRSRKKETAGNLLFYENDVYSLTPTGLSSFPQLAAKIKDTETKLAANANDPEGLLDLAMLQHDDGRLSPAIENYRKTLANKPADGVRSKAREKLFEAITELLQSDFNAGEPMLAEYRTLCEVTIPADATEAQKALLTEEELRRKSNYFCLVAKGKEAQGKLLDAFDNYMQFGTLVGNKEMVSVIDEPNTFARPDVWARGRISSMVKKATPEQRKPLEDKVVAEWAKVKDANDLEALRGFVKVFGGLFDAGTDARVALADRLSAGGGEDDAREAEYLLLSLRGADDDPAGAAKATEALARLYIRKGLLDDAVGMYAELGSKHAGAMVRDGKTGAQVFAELVTDKRFLPYLEPMTIKWPFPKMARGTDTTGGGGSGRNTTDIDPGPEALPFFRRYRLVFDSNSRSGQGFGLKVFDRVTNQEYWSSPGVGYPTQHQGFFTQAGMPMRLVQVKGHVAVVTVHDNNQQTGMPRARAFAFDVAEKKKLWEVDLFGTGPTATANTAQVSQVMEADGLRLTYQDGWSAKVGQQWVVEAAYTLLLTRDGLVAKDNARGTVLWTKANVSARTNMIGDGQHVFLYDAAPDGSTSAVRCFRAADGVEVSVPDSSAAFPTVKGAKFFGRRVLAFDTDAGKKAIRLYDLLTGKDVWKREVGGDGWPLKCEDDAFAGFVTAAGDVVVVDALTGKDVFKSKIEPRKAGHLEKLTDAMLLSDADRFFVVLNRALENKNPFGMQQVFAQQINAVRATGAMYAFSRADGKRLWATEELEDMYIVTDQFSELPIILSAGYWQKAAANGGIVSQEMKVVGIDKATGKLLYYKVGTNQGAFYSLLSDPKTGSIELLNYSGQRVKFVPEGTAVSSAVPKGTEVPAPDAKIRIMAVPAIKIAPVKK